MELLSRLDVSSLEELKEHVRKWVKNVHLKKRHLKEIDNVMRMIESLGSEPGRVSGPLGGTSSGTCGKDHNLWRVLKVAVVRLLSPERVLRDMSVLKSLFVSGQVGRPL